MSSIAELRRLSSERGERLQVKAADLVGRWVYFQGGVSAATSRAYCQAQRGGRVLELQPTARAHGAPHLVALCVLRVMHVETVEEEIATRPVDPRTEDQRRVDFLAQLHRAGGLWDFIRKFPSGHRATDFRAALDEAMARPPPHSL